MPTGSVRVVAAPRGVRPRRSWPQRLLIAFNLCFVAGTLVIAGGLGYLNWKLDQLPRVELGEGVLAEEEAPDEPQNYLIVGTDSSEGLSEDDPVTIGREDLGVLSDTIMVLRVDPNAEQAQLLSFPRDLWVPIAGGGNQRINTAISVGGAQALIETLEENFSIPVHHYLQVDFLGFKELVRAVDGVPIYFDRPLRDPNSGLNVMETGCITLDPDQALGFARSRHLEYQTDDGSWDTDPSGDIGRIHRQQHFIRQALRRAIARGVRNPVTLNNLVDVGIQNVTVDDTLAADDILALGRRFRTFDPETLATYDLDVYDDNVNGASVLQLAETQRNQEVLDIFRGVGLEDVGEPESVRVQVLNGSGQGGQAGVAAADLEGVGFDITGTGDAERFDYQQTTVRYAPGQEPAASLVARHLAGEVAFEPVLGIEGADVSVITGFDYGGVDQEPAPEDSVDLPEPEAPADGEVVPFPELAEDGEDGEDGEAD